MRNRSHRFWPCVAAVVAVAVIAVPAASAGVHKYDTRVGFTWEGWHNDTAGFHGGAISGVQSKVKKCERRRRVVLYRRRAGVDRKVGYDRSKFAHQYGYGDFMIWPHAGTFHSGDRVFVRVERKVLDDGDVCRADRSLTKRWR